MKIRWMQMSVRFRITPTELQAIERGQHVVERLQIPGYGSWTAEIVPGASRTAINMNLACLRLMLSAANAARLAEQEREGVYFATPDPSPFCLYIEKDLPCAHARAQEIIEPVTETFTCITTRA